MLLMWEKHASFCFSRSATQKQGLRSGLVLPGDAESTARTVVPAAKITAVKNERAAESFIWGSEFKRERKGRKRHHDHVV
jgi:hypothetical protein